MYTVTLQVIEELVICRIKILVQKTKYRNICIVIRTVFKVLQINSVDLLWYHTNPPARKGMTFGNPILTLYSLWEQHNFPSD